MTSKGTNSIATLGIIAVILFLIFEAKKYFSFSPAIAPMSSGTPPTDGNKAGGFLSTIGSAGVPVTHVVTGPIFQNVSMGGGETKYFPLFGFVGNGKSYSGVGVGGVGIAPNLYG